MDWSRIIDNLEAKLPDRNITKDLGLRSQYIYDIKSGKSKNPSADFVLKLISTYNINPDWFENENFDFFNKDKSTNQQVISSDNKSVSSSYKVPLLRQKVSCGTGVDWRNDDNIDRYVDVFEFIPGLALVHPYALCADGSSMAGFGIRDGDIIFFDSRPDQIIREDVYVFALDGDVFCKRIEIDRMKRTLSLLSMRNTSDVLHAELWQTLKTDDTNFTDRFHLFGRVVAWLHINGMLERNA